MPDEPVPKIALPTPAPVAEPEPKPIPKATTLPRKNNPMAPRTPASTLTPKPATPIRALENGAWQFSGHKGLKADVLKLIEADTTITAHWKAALTAEIEAMNCASLDLTAHYQPIGKDVIGSFHIKPLF